MSTTTELNHKSYCKTEYNPLKRVILCEPQYMTIREEINETQKEFKDVGIHIEKALEQHKQFVSVLKEHDIDVVSLPVLPKYPEQVFTRDIGFTIGHTIFVADMAHRIRQGEEKVLRDWLENEEISYFSLVGDQIEGGDVIVHGSKVYVGLSNRTNQQAIDHLKILLPEYEVNAISFTKKYLHLDCVFNIISKDEALFFPNAFNEDERSYLDSHFDLIEVTEEEQFTLGTNVLSIGNKKIISLPVNRNVNEQLRKRGFDVIEVDISEIIKSGGSFRCCTLPLLRKEPLSPN